MRLIDADALIPKIDDCSQGDILIGTQAVVRLIKAAPTIHVGVRYGNGESNVVYSKEDSDGVD